MSCGRPSSERVKSSLERSGTIEPFLSRTVASTLTTFTWMESVACGLSCGSASTVGRDASDTAAQANRAGIEKRKRLNRTTQRFPGLEGRLKLWDILVSINPKLSPLVSVDAEEDS